MDRPLAVGENSELRGSAYRARLGSIVLSGPGVRLAAAEMSVG
jgi:hypothetical protein